MSTVRLSADSLLYYKQNRQSTNQGRHAFVSFVRDSSDSDQESDNSSDDMTLTSRLKTNSKKHQSDDKLHGVTPLHSIAVNLEKRLSENVLNNTPSRILQLALQEENEESQDDFNGFTTAGDERSQRQAFLKTPSKTYQVSLKDQENAAMVVKSQRKRNLKEDSISENELSDSESRRSQQITNNRKEAILPYVSSKRTTAAIASSTEKKKRFPINSDSDNSFQEVEPVKIDKKSFSPTKRRGNKNAENPPIEIVDVSKNPVNRRGRKKIENRTIGTADASEPPAKGRRKKNSENPLTETADALEPAAKRPRVATKAKANLTEESATASNEHTDINQVPKVLRRKNASKKTNGEKMDASSKRPSKKPAVSENPKPRGRPKKLVNTSANNITDIGKSAPADDVHSYETVDHVDPGKSVSAGNISTTEECVSISRSPTKSLDNNKKEISKRARNALEEIPEEAKSPEVENLSMSQNKETDKSQEKNYKFSSSSESEEDDDDDNDFIFPTNNLSRKTTSPKIAVSLDIFQTPTKGINNVLKLTSSKTPKSNRKPVDSSPVPLLRTPMRRLSLAKQFLPNREEQSNTAEDVSDTEEILREPSSMKTPLKARLSLRTAPALKTATPEIISNTKTKEVVIQKRLGLTQHKPSTSTPSGNGKSGEETAVSKRKSSAVALKTPSPNKRIRSRLSASQHRKQPIDSQNDIYEDASGFIQTAQKITSMMLRSGDPNHRTQLSSVIDPSTLPVPPLRKARFNVYMTPLDGPVRAVQYLSNDEYRVTWLYLQPKIVYPLKTYDPMTVMQLKGSVEFRNDPFVPSHILLNSSTRLVELEAGLLLHVVNTGEEVASFQITEML